MVNKGLLVRLESKPGKDTEIENFLHSGLALVEQEPATTAWFAIRFGQNAYGIFDVFPDEAGREAHLSGLVARALMEKSGSLLASPPEIHKLDVLADKLPHNPLSTADTKGMLLTFRARAGQEPEMEKFLRDAKPFVDHEPETTAWFGVHLDNGEYGIFDVFPSSGGRLQHLTGQVPVEMAKHVFSLFGSLPDPSFPDILAEKFTA